MPFVDEMHDATALLVLRAVLVAVNLEALGIVMREKRLGKAQHDMTAQVGRDIADANLAPLLSKAVEERRHIAEKFRVGTMRTIHFLLRHAQKMQREENIAPLHPAKLGSLCRSRRLFVSGSSLFCQSHDTRRLPEKVADLLDIYRCKSFLALQEQRQHVICREQFPLGKEDSRMEERAVDGLRLLL